jgi:[ribosomal protein S18]-alanine N-acetyltransferase
MSDWLQRLTRRAFPRLVPAGPQHASDIAALHAQAFRRGWSEEEVNALLTDRAVLGDCATINGKFAGFILSRRAADEAEILSFAVPDNQRGHGVGRALLDIHLRRLAGVGARALFLEVEEGNEPALKLYRRAGFRQVGQRPNYYPRPVGRTAAALILRRDLV